MNNDVISPKKKLLNSDHMGAFSQTGEYKIHYYEEGQGQPLVLVHGLGQSLYTWHRCMESLSSQYHVYAPDLIGHGYSNKPSAYPYDVDAFAQNMIDFMDSVGLRRVHMVGFSTGAICALRVAQLHPERVNRLCVISPGGITHTMPFMVRALRSPVLSWFFQMMINTRAVGNLLDSSFFDQTLIDEEMLYEYYTPLCENGGKAVLARALQAFDEEETMQGLRNVQCETQIIWGADDSWHGLDIAEQFHVSINKSELHVIRNCGHLVHEEKVDKFIERAARFFEAGIEDGASAESDRVSSSF